MEISEGAVIRPRRITPYSISIILQMLQKPHSLIVKYWLRLGVGGQFPRNLKLITDFFFFQIRFVSVTVLIAM